MRARYSISRKSSGAARSDGRPWIAEGAAATSLPARGEETPSPSRLVAPTESSPAKTPSHPRLSWLGAVLLVALILAAEPVAALPNGAELNPVLGSSLNLGLAFTDSANRTAPLSTFAGGKPTLILLGYHRCPNLCGVAQLDLAEGLAASGMAPASYSVLFVSVDPEETPADASAAQGKLTQAATGLDLSAWHFLTGHSQALDSITSALGVTVRRAERGLYVHPVAVAATTSEGRLSRVITGLDYTPRDLRLAVVEASTGRIGSLGDRILLLCSSFDMATGRYTSAVMAGLRLATIATLIALGVGVLALARRGRA